MLYDQVIRNDYGYYELKDKPSKSALVEYYTNKYFQQTKGAYQKEYSTEELTYIDNRLKRKYNLLRDIGLNRRENISFLDIGCGEGWALSFFAKKGFRVKGIDYSSYACQSFNPDFAAQVITNDPIDALQQLAAQNEYFDFIQLDNVLEHVLEPELMLQEIKKILRPGGAVLVEVPNDFSPMQQYLFEHKKIKGPFWVVIPDHISYFNPKGLEKLMMVCGYKKACITGDYPIDIHLLQEETNYVNDKSKGKIAHKTRLQFENLLCQLSVDKTNAFYEASIEMGISRQILAIFLVT